MKSIRSRKKKTTAKPTRGKKAGQLSKGKITSLQTALTTSNIDKVLSEVNIIEEDIAEILEEDVEELEDQVISEDSGEGDEKEDYEEEEDDYIDYDEVRAEDPFDVEEKNAKNRSIYIAEVSVKDGTPSVKFLQVPKFETDDILLRNTLLKRFKLFNQMTCFLAEKQIEYFSSSDKKKLNNLNQQDLVKYMHDSGENLSKNHISRMLDALFLKLEGLGYVPSKFLFKRYGHMTGLSKDEKLELGEEFLVGCNKGLSQLDKAKKLVEFIEKKKGIKIRLSSNPNEHDRYKSWKKIITEIEKGRKHED